MKKQTLRRFYKMSGILLMSILLCSCSTPLEATNPIGQVSIEQHEATPTPETEIIPFVVEKAAVKTELPSTLTAASAAASPVPESTSTAKPTASPTATPLPETNESQGAPTPKPTSLPTATPTEQPTAHPTVKPLPTAAPIPTAAPTATPKPTATPTPTSTAVPKIEEVWIVDVPGHYEAVEEVTEVWVDEQGHWEESGYWASDWVFECNQCDMQYSTVEAVNQHLDDSFDWDTMTGHSSYTQVSGPMYWVEAEPEWVVDVPGHYKTVTKSKEVWIDEQGHWETVTT